MIDLAKVGNRLRGRSNKLLGDAAEAIIAHRLKALGFQCIVRLETGWRVHRIGGRITGATPLAKVTGDFRAVAPGGRSVLVEVKRRPDRIRYSDIERHQAIALDEHYLANGLSLVAWVSNHGVVVFDWSRVNLRPGQALTWDEAKQHQIGGSA